MESVQRMNNILSNLSIDGQCVASKSHRHISFYDIKLGKSNVRKIEGRAREIALGVQSKTIPLVKLLPEDGVVRLQVATRDADSINLFGLLSKRRVPKDMGLPFLLGETDEGEPMWFDMTKAPHLLVAGSTGSGKSVLLHNLIANAAMMDAVGIRKVRIHLIDPKRVEFSPYEQMIGGAINDIGYDYEYAILRLTALVEEMESRYESMKILGIRNAAERSGLFPYIFVIIDEVSDLMLQDKKTGIFQNLVVRLAQMGRAAGIHMVLATQRPSVDVLTGLIKANFPARIACRTASKTDSRVVLDAAGAETLLGRGDALMKNAITDRIRFQVAYVKPEHTIKNDNAVRRVMRKRVEKC